jgi:chlorobactene lauroyltransferase
MIEAEKHKTIEAVFAAINRRMLRRAFNSLRLSGGGHVGALDRNLPMIFYGNHSCWWDGLIEFFLGREEFGVDSYLMMDEEQLTRYRFFRWIGAFSVNRNSPREAVASMRYAISLFDRPNRVLWIYPQGVMKPNDARPLAFYPGIGRIVQALGSAQVVPIVHRYEFLMEQRPDALMSLGKPLLVTSVRDPRTMTRELEDRLTLQLDDIRRCVAAGALDDFTVILKGNSSTNIRYDRARNYAEWA